MKNENLIIPDWVVNEMVSYLYSHGMIMKNKRFDGVSHIPITVFPSPVVKSFFDKIEFYQIAFNKLIDKMSRDHEFLHSTLRNMSVEDSLVRKYLEISTKSYQNENRQNIQLGIFRNDYMIDKLKKFIYQVEINTIASSMGAFSDGLKSFFVYFSQKYPEYYSKYLDNENYVPVNKENVIDSIADSMFTAIKLFSSDYQSTIIVFVIQENERNEFDQRAIENYLYEKYNIKSRRLTLNEILKYSQYDSNQNILIESRIVSLFYFRAGYTEGDFPDENSWKAREMIELSTAIKCPNVNTFLCTFKIFQHELQKSEIMRKFIPDGLIANDIERFFKQIFYIDEMTSEEKDSLFTEIRGDVSKYIVKPQKEGGGNNYYNNDILPLLPNSDSNNNDNDNDNDRDRDINPILKHSIVMERINPPETDTLIIQDGVLKKCTCISEISVYGIIISDEKSILMNKSVGFLVRTKETSIQEGGVAAGYSAVDLPFLVGKNGYDASEGKSLTYY